MSEYTTQEVLALIEENNGPRELDLSSKDLSGIDLSRGTIQAHLKRVRDEEPQKIPAWFSEDKGSINLQGAYLERANLQGARLWRADLQGASLWNADLRGADLEGADLQGATLWNADLRGALLGGTDLREADLKGADLRGADLGSANLRGADLWNSDLREALLAGADLQETQLQEAHLERVDFSSISSRGLEGAYFYHAFLDDTRLKQEQLGTAIGEEPAGEYDRAKEAYLILKNNFAEIGRYEDESWAYVKERKMERAMNHPRNARKYFAESEKLPGDSTWRSWAWWRFYGRHTWKWLLEGGVELICGYGESLGRTMASILALWITFAFIYGAIGGVWGPWQETTQGQIRYVTRDPRDLLAFSLRALTTQDITGLEARNTLAMRWLTGIESFLGIALTGLFGFVLGHKIRRG